MISNEIDEKKTKYFVIAIILLIILSVILIIHFNNKSLVSGNDEDVKVTTTSTITTKVPTTKKKKTTKKVETVVEEETVEEIVSESVVYKSAIDEVNKIIYNYKLSDEINNDDVILSKVLGVTESLKTNNVIALYDISLYDKEGNKKDVKNTVIDISIPLSKDMLEYDEYKVIYIDDEDKISEEKFDIVVLNNYIKFSTSHLSKFGIVGIKKEVVNDKDEEVEEEKTEEVIIDLNNVDIDVLINDEIKEENNLYVSTTDKIHVTVNGLDSEYKLYYLLKNDEEVNEYKEFNNNIFSSINTPNKYTLLIKLVVANNEKVFEVGTINVYDIVFVYDKFEEIKEDLIIGEIKDEEGIESDYIDSSKNMDIVIDSVLEEEITEEDTIVIEEVGESGVSETIEENISQSELPEQNTESDVKINEDNNQEESIIPEEDTNESENIDDKASIILKGNVYLVEKTDISNLEITGYLIIDTSEDITFGKNVSNELLTSNIYTITIRSKEFSINGIKYTYEYKENDLIIKRISEENNEEVDANLEINNLFKDFDIIKDEEDLILANPNK